MSKGLEDILSFAPDNRAVFREITDFVKAGANSIIPFVGAGLSEPIYPGWGKALSIIANKITNLETRNKINELINKKELLAAAQELEDIRTPVNLCHDFAEIFSPNELNKHLADIRKMAVWLLPLLFKGMAVTTNLDRMLEFVYQDCSNPFTNVFLPGERKELEAFALTHPNAHYLYKFHGSIEADGNADYGKIVFSESAYNRHYAPDSDLIKTLRNVYGQKVLLFLGCSLEKDRTLDILRETIAPGRVNYAIVNCKQEDIDKKTKQLGELQVRAILYPDGQFESVRIILESLLETADPEEYKQLLHHIGSRAMETKTEVYSGRFLYKSDLYETVGRQEEFSLLESFLGDEAQFRWWAIIGPGGTGKSRLAFSFEERIPFGWACVRPTYKDGQLSIPEPKTNTLYIVDYARVCAEKLGDWIEETSNASYNFKVRLLMLERDGGDWEERLCERFNGRLKAENARYRKEQGFLKLEPLKDEEILLLMDKFATAVSALSDTYKKWKGEHVGRQLLNALQRIDPNMRRPLFALFLTDSWLSGKNPARWNRQQLLDTVLERERALLIKCAEPIMLPALPRILIRKVQVLLRYATVLGDASDEQLKNLAPEEWKSINETAKEKGLDSLMAYLGLGHCKIVFALQPDILGEYFVLKWLLNDENGEKRKEFLNHIWSFPLETAVFFSRISIDFNDILDEAHERWEWLFFSPDRMVNIGIYAMYLVNVTACTTSLTVAKTIVDQLENLMKTYNDDNQRIALSYAKALFNLSNKQTVREKTETINRLETLVKSYSDNQEIALAYAKGLTNFLHDQTEKDKRETIKRLETIAQTYPDNQEIALVYVKGLYNFSCDQTEKDKRETIKRLETIAQTYPDNQEIALIYVKGLFNLSNEQTVREKAETINRLETLIKSYPDNQEIASIYAKGLYNFFCDQTEKDKRETIKRLESIAQTYPDNQEIALAYAKGLLTLSFSQTMDEINQTTEEMIERLETIAKTFPQNAEIKKMFLLAMKIWSVINKN